MLWRKPPGDKNYGEIDRIKDDKNREKSNTFVSMLWIVFIVIVSVAALIKGATGFGFSLIALPVLLFWFPLSHVVPVLAICNFISSFIIAVQTNAFIIHKNDKFLILFGLIGTLLGVFFLKKIESSYLIIALAIIFSLLSLSFLFGFRFPIKKHTRASIIWGFIAGIMSGSYSISGPPLTLFLTSKNVTNENFRKTFAIFNVFIPAVSIVLFFSYGLITRQSLIYVLIAVPILFLGAFIGKGFTSVHTGVFRKVVIIISLLASVLLLFKV